MPLRTIPHRVIQKTVCGDGHLTFDFYGTDLLMTGHDGFRRTATIKVTHFRTFQLTHDGVTSNKNIFLEKRRPSTRSNLWRVFNAKISNFQKKVPFQYQTMTHFLVLAAAQCVRTQLKPFNYGFNQTFAPSSWNVVKEGGGLVLSFSMTDHITHSCHLWLASKQINFLASIFTTQFIMPFHEICIM